MSGYVKLWRKSEQSEIFQLSPLHWKVWCWLLMHVSRQAYRLQRIGVDIQVGELFITYDQLAKAVSWVERRKYRQPTMRQLRTILLHLQLLEMVELRQAERQTGIVVKVLHWEQYQGAGEATPTESAKTLRQGSDRLATTEQEEKKKIVKKTYAQDGPEFEQFWLAYPKKKDKAKARAAFGKAIERASVDEVMAGLRAQLPEMARTEMQFIPYPTTWLNGERWTDEVARDECDRQLDMLVARGYR